MSSAVRRDPNEPDPRLAAALASPQRLALQLIARAARKQGFDPEAIAAGLRAMAGRRHWSPPSEDDALDMGEYAWDLPLWEQTNEETTPVDPSTNGHSPSGTDADLAALLASWVGAGEDDRRAARQAFIESLAAAEPFTQNEYVSRAVESKLAPRKTLAQAISTARHLRQRQEKAETRGEQLSVEQLAALIQEDDHFAQDAGGLLYRYRGGAYRPDGARYVKQRVKELLHDRAAVWSSHRAEEAVEYLRVDAPALLDPPPLNLINVENGLVDVEKRELREHTPRFRSAVQLPVTFDPDATCPAIEQFVAEVFPEDAQALAWEITAWLMVADTSIQRAVLLQGEGANGKSTFLALLCAFLGRQNTAALSLHRLEADRFAASRLVGKLANICPDLPSEHLAGTSTFKALTGGDAIAAEYKFRDSFDFVPFARLVFSCNQAPRSQDSSAAFFRRWYVLPFDRVFQEGARGTLSRGELAARLQNPRELSGLLNRALAVLPDLQRRGALYESATMKAAWTEFQAVTDPLSLWLAEGTEADPVYSVTKKALLEAYNRAMNTTGNPAMTPKAFGQRLRRLRPELGEAQRIRQDEEGNEKKVWVWTGIRLRGGSD